MTGIGIQQPADHALVLRAVLRGFLFEKFDVALRERNRHLYAFLAKGERLRGRQKVRNDLQVAQGFIRVHNLSSHKFRG